MPINCKSVSVKDVIKFFEDDIDGMGKYDGQPRNEGIPNSIRQFQNWEFCELTEDEFMLLVIPDGSLTIIKDREFSTLDSIVKKIIEERVEILQCGGNLDHLIVTELLSGEGPSHASFYIKDGAKRVIALKVYFENNPYRLVKAYIGRKIV